MIDRLMYSDWSVQRLREEFWRWSDAINRSREKPIDDADADVAYGQARQHLTEVAEELKKRYDDPYFEMDGVVWYNYL